MAGKASSIAEVVGIGASPEAARIDMETKLPYEKGHRLYAAFEIHTGTLESGQHVAVCKYALMDTPASETRRTGTGAYCSPLEEEAQRRR